MPLNTQIKDETGKPLTLNWGWWHVTCMMEAAKAEAGVDDFQKTELWDKGEITLKNRHGYEDPSDGERLELKPGYTLSMWRSYR